ncbi:MAG: stalk domain-containing protein [Desulfocucumaceae bacterium]
MRRWITIFSIGIAMAVCVPLVSSAAADSGLAEIIVINTADTINGNTSGIGALKADPGPDGVSFREALKAANNTAGRKKILFSPALSGATIKIGGPEAPKDHLLLSGGDITINGDINGDGKPDITLDGTLGKDGSPSSNGLNIWSSNNRVETLSFFGFKGTAIHFACPDSGFNQKIISGNQVTGNVINGANGIVISTLGLTGAKYYRELSDIQFRDTLISKNRVIVTGQDNIFIMAGIGGQCRNRVENLTVTDNYVSGGGGGIGIIAGDTASDYHGLPGPVVYSDDNTIENVTISNNTIESPKSFGISVEGGNMGNRNNKVLKARIKNNTVSGAGLAGIGIFTAQMTETRITSDNLMADIEVTENKITGCGTGMMIGAGDKPHGDENKGVNNNSLEKVLVAENDISRYSKAGIEIWGGWSLRGEGTSGNCIEQLTILNNRIVNNDSGTVGLEIIGGRSQEGPAHNNLVKGVEVRNNTVRGNNTGIWLAGGQGREAVNNSVDAVFQGNILEGNQNPFGSEENDQGAAGNSLKFKVLEPEAIKVVINGSPLNMDVPPAIVNERTLVPLRAIFEALGAEVSWDQGTETVTGTRGSTTVILKINRPEAMVNGSARKLDVPPQIMEGRTMVPARFIAESLGSRVDWDGDSRTVIVTMESMGTVILH